MAVETHSEAKPVAAPWPVTVPLPLAMILLTLAIGVAAGMGADGLVASFNTGFGRALGEFALILVPALVLAAALDRAEGRSAGLATVLLAPAAGAGMVCPDTSYAALSPMAGSRRLSVAFGGYAGFKLLFPAGPVIVATALGAFDHRVVLAAVPMFAVAWVVGLAYARRFEDRPGRRAGESGLRLPRLVALPLGTLFGVLILGFVLKTSVAGIAGADLLLGPKGALLLAAIVALALIGRTERTAAIDSGMRRTAQLLMTIGAASAFGLVLVEVLPVRAWTEQLVAAGVVLPALFAVTAAFKVIKGSSMATFATIGGLAAALLPSLGVSPTAAALAICAGSFGAITPNDSFYWLIKNDALAHVGNGAATCILALGAACQGLAAMAVLLLMNAAGLV